MANVWSYIYLADCFNELKSVKVIHIIIKGKIKGKSKRGRPRMTYSDQIKKNITVSG